MRVLPVWAEASHPHTPPQARTFLLPLFLLLPLLLLVLLLPLLPFLLLLPLLPLLLLYPDRTALATFDPSTAAGACLDTLYPYLVWSAKRLNWSIVTRAHVPRRRGAAGGAAARPVCAAAGPRHRRWPRLYAGVACRHRWSAPMAGTGDGLHRWLAPSAGAPLCARPGAGR